MQTVQRPSYESDAKRLAARIAILEATPQSATRDKLIAWHRTLLKRVEVAR